MLRPPDRRPFLREFLRYSRIRDSTLVRGKGNALRRILKDIFAAGLIFGAGLCANAQTHDANEVSATLSAAPAQSTQAQQFEPLAARRWEYGPFVNLGNGVGDRLDYHFFALGFQLSRSLFSVVHAGPLSGRFEFGGNIMPLWQAYTPSPYTSTYRPPDSNVAVTQYYGGGTFTGLSITPVVFRWNF